MKKIVIALLTLVAVSQAQALSIEDCQKYSDETVAKMLLDSVALGAQTGSNNAHCEARAQSLDVAIVGDNLLETSNFLVGSTHDYAITKIERPSEENLFRAVVHYKFRTLNNQQISGEFSFKRHTNFIRKENIARLKCASISNPPSQFFMLSQCRN